jgi:hypothetical protein
MSYYGTTQLSSLVNPPRQLVAGIANVPALTGSTAYLTTQGSTAAFAQGPGNAGGGLWYYCSTNTSTEAQATNFFSDGFYLGMRPGDIVMGVSFTSLGSSVTTWLGAVTVVSTAGAQLSTGSVMSSSFNSS